MSVDVDSSGPCPAAGFWDGVQIRCDLPAGHRTFSEHLDERRGLIWGFGVYAQRGGKPELECFIEAARGLECHRCREPQRGPRP